MKVKLKPLEAYIAAILFLDHIYKQTKFDDLGSLLGDMSLLEDNLPVDFAIWEDWLEAISNKTNITKEEAFKAMQQFLQGYAQRTESDEIASFLSLLQNQQKKTSYYKAWQSYLEVVLKKKSDTRIYLDLKK